MITFDSSPPLPWRLSGRSALRAAPAGTLPDRRHGRSAILPPQIALAATPSLVAKKGTNHLTKRARLNGLLKGLFANP